MKIKKEKCNLGHDHITAVCSIVDCTEEGDSNGQGLFRMTPPVGSLSAADEAWICLNHINMINAMFGVPAIERP